MVWQVEVQSSVEDAGLCVVNEMIHVGIVLGDGSGYYVLLVVGYFMVHHAIADDRVRTRAR